MPVLAIAHQSASSGSDLIAKTGIEILKTSPQSIRSPQCQCIMQLRLHALGTAVNSASTEILISSPTTTPPVSRA